MKPVPIGTLADDKLVALDLTRLVDTRALIQANSGGGKSYLLRLIAEQAAGKVQTIILDPEGEFATLREKFDFLLAGQGGDIPAEPRSGELLARKLVELQASAVVDLSGLKLPDRRRFVRVFLESLMHLPKQHWRPLLVMLDEAHVFCPERQAGEAESTGAVIDLMSQGRKRGYCGILATQRLSKLHKDAEAETNNVCIGRTWLDIDQERAGKLLGFGKERRQEMRDLEPGTFFAFGPAWSINGVFQFMTDVVQTTHPKAGQRHKLTPPKPSEAVKNIAADLADLPQQAEAEVRDMAAAKKRITELERELRAKPAPATDPTAVERAAQQGRQQAEREWAGTKKALEREMAQLRTKLSKIAGLAGGLESGSESRDVPIETPKVRYEERIVASPTPARLRSATRHEPVQANGDESTLTGPEQRILNALAWLESIGNSEPEQTAVAFLAGYTIGGGAWNNPRGRLNTRGLLEYRGSGRLALTEAGRALAAAPDAPLTTEELHRAVLQRLPGPERKLLQVLLDAYPDDLPYEELAQRSGYAEGGGAFNNPRGRLRSLGLIHYPTKGQVAALPLLFID